MHDKPAPWCLRSSPEGSGAWIFAGPKQRTDEGALRSGALKAERRVTAVCLLFSFLHPAHETRVREIVREEMPDCSVSLSSEVLPQIREYYRLSTTVINAYLQPILARYVAQLDRRLAGAGLTTRQKYIMQSNGGMATFAAASRRAVTTVLSGPAGVTASAIVHGSRDSSPPSTWGTSCDG
jgi:N-methylhydantoinase A